MNSSCKYGKIKGFLFFYGIAPYHNAKFRLQAYEMTSGVVPWMSVIAAKLIRLIYGVFVTEKEYTKKASSARENLQEM